MKNLSIIHVLLVVSFLISSVYALNFIKLSYSIQISTQQQNVIFSLTNIAENSQTNFDYSYAENIGDGRGITFGIIGFTSGTFDGTILIKHLNELDPSNYLVKYLPAFEAIDELPHPDGMTDDTTGLSNFISDWEAYGDQDKVREAQLDKLKELYWNPSVQKAEEIGAKLPITLAFLYDTCVNHGADGDEKDKGLKQLVDETNDKIGTISSGVEETTWLNELYNVRKAYMESDPTWAQALDRIEMHRRILNSGNVNLNTPFQVTCYGDSFTINGESP